MNLLATLRIALRALGKNKLRAGLTVLGVVIGISAVTLMVSLGQSMSTLVQGQVQGLGTNVIVVFPARARQGGVRQANVPRLTANDGYAIAVECQAVLATSPLVMTTGQVISGNANWSPHDLAGVGPDYLTVRNWALSAGEFFTQRDIAGATKVCVVGRTVATKLFQSLSPLGETLRIKNIPFRVIGVLERKGANLVGEDQDDIVLMPFSTVRKRLQGSNFSDVHALLASARSSSLMNEAELEINQLLAERHRIRPGEPPDYVVQNTTEIAAMLGTITGAMTLMLSSIAGISLVVGGVGIMNIMLVSVTERTREIGIRMAVGARPRDILRQFLVEAVLLSTLGGVVGVALGIAGSVGVIKLINRFSSGADWPVVISFSASGVALAFAAGVGIFFGYYPARRASRLDPIEALRYE